MSISKYTIGDYLLDRIAELGITEMFGVPGDYNLHFLDHVVNHNKLRWIGSANELNAGYAADGYARIRGAAALLTTYGVGELSATNAIAGSYAESLPVIHIVGAPKKSIQEKQLKVHHSLADGDFQHFLRMASEVSCAQTDLKVANATWEIDRVLRTAMLESKPAYILMAVDVAATPAAPPSAPLPLAEPVSLPDVEKAFAEAAREFLRGKKTTILADHFVHRLGEMENLRSLVASSGLPTATLNWGKSLVDESAANFVGTYIGAASAPGTRHAVEDAEALITLGVEFTDNTTAGFTENIDEYRRLDVHKGAAMVGGEPFTPIQLSRAIEILTDVVSELELEGMDVDPAECESTKPEPVTDAPLSQVVLWQEVAQAIEGDNIVVADQGTSFFGLSTARLPKGAMFIGQPQWGSIGYSLPAMFGAGIADPERRPLLLIGDGSAQLTIQELGQVIREGLPAVIVLINNDGYTVERVIHGPEELYNDIPTWRWQEALKFFGAKEEDCLSLVAATGLELREALQQAEANPDKLVFIEAKTQKMDSPEVLKKIAERL